MFFPIGVKITLNKLRAYSDIMYHNVTFGHPNSHVIYLQNFFGPAIVCLENSDCFFFMGQSPVMFAMTWDTLIWPNSSLSAEKFSSMMSLMSSLCKGGCGSCLSPISYDSYEELFLANSIFQGNCLAIGRFQSPNTKPK